MVPFQTKAMLVATLLVAAACLASGFAPGPGGAFLARGQRQASCAAVPLRRMISAPALRPSIFSLMAKEEGTEESKEEAAEPTAEESKEEAPAEPEVRRSPGASRAAPAGRLCDSVVLRPLRYQWFGLLCPHRRRLLRSWSGSPQSACCDPPCGLRCDRALDACSVHIA